MISPRIRRGAIAAAHDAVMAGLSFWLAIYIRLGDDQIYLANDYLKSGTALFVLVCVAVFASMRLYRGLWRYASMRDLVAITKAVSLSILVFAVLMFTLNRLEGVPRSVFFINWMLLLFMLGAPRFAYRAFKDRTLRWEMTLEEVAKIPVLLIGANAQAEQFIRESSRNPRAPYWVVGIADDDAARHGRTIHNVPILGGADMVERIVGKLERKSQRPQKIVISGSLDGPKIQELLAVADRLGLPLARLPELSQFRHGISDKPDIQPIAIEDLLGRPQNVLDRDAMRQLVAGKTVLITGAGGTIGGELTRQIAGYGPKQLVVLEACEFNLYQIEREIRAAFSALPLVAVLGDVRDEAHVEALFKAHKPQIVVHAAAIKHVPLAEDNCEETVLTNVFGTQTIAEASLRHQAETMVMISTDKAVNPTNLMGASKRLAECFCQALGEGQPGATQFVTVRFGNVLGSTGSVVPLFQEQLARGGPLTVTHPDMTRFFMTVREAVELVLQAAALGRAMPQRKECIFVLDMGTPVRILDLAQQMIRLAGLTPGRDIAIEFTGLRPGEKLYEELFYENENTVKTSHQSIMLASPKQVELAWLRERLNALKQACRERNAQSCLRLMRELVPEFKPVGHHENHPRASLRL